MKKKDITTISRTELLKKKGKTRPDAPAGPPLPPEFWKNAKVSYPEAPKEQVAIRFDADLLEWFRGKGRGYQTRMNAVLRSYYEAHKDDPAVKR